MKNRNDDLIEQFAKTFIGIESLFNSNFKVTSFPKFEILKNESKNQHLLRVLLAGYSKEDIQVHTDNGVLTIEHVKLEHEDDQNLNGFIYQSEKLIARRAFKLEFKLDRNIEITEAKFENGILSIFLTKTNSENRTKVDIS